ncbi:nucleolar protein dao-5-like [Dendronephthya gigantea]|uniref:nucleolar protein dao-5-like n=1 Tax=Dendronephthya gigantea TaxID=151771 RepID=UPI00106968F6|nr:nucleolar protein dao-5-like [Dendronephthya gigantea]
MEELHSNLSSDLVENEKFDFDLAFSPDIFPNQINDSKGKDEEEVFFGPVGFTEQCVATRINVLQEESNIIPLSPLTEEQVVEVFKEATKVALQFEKLSDEAKSCISTSISSNSPVCSSILKLYGGSKSPCPLTGKLSSDSPKKSYTQFELDFKENIQPLLSEEKFHAYENGHIDLADKNVKSYPANFESDKIMSSTNEKKNNTKKNKVDQKEQIEISVQNEPTMLEKIIFEKDSEQVDGKMVLERVMAEIDAAETKDTKYKKNPLAKVQKSNLPKFGLRNSRLPKSVNTEKSQSAFSSPIKTTGSSKKREDERNKTARMEKLTKNAEKSGVKKSSTKLQKSVPAKQTQASPKVHSKLAKPLAKRKIFDSSESLYKLETKDLKTKSKPKLQVPEQSKIPAVKPRRRRRSSSLSSLDSSQSSASSHTSPDDNATSKLKRPSTKIPTTKASLASSFGLIRRSKFQDTTADKKPQPLKALPRPGFAPSVKSSKTDTKSVKETPQASTELEVKDNKMPMPATPRSTSSLPVAKRRSSFKSSMSSTSSRESSPLKYSTPSKPMGKIPEPRATTSTCKRRSSNPTPSSRVPSSTSRILRSLGDDSLLLSPASRRKKSQESATKSKTNRKLIPDDDPHSINIASTHTVDDLLDCDNSDAVFKDIVPIQPTPVEQADLIDLSGF